MNALTPVNFDPSVPAHLRRPEMMRIAAAAAGGIQSFQAPHRISIRAGRFHLVDPEGNETDSQEHNGVMLDVIVLDANPVVSKLYYDKPYQPGQEPEHPACFSDNGTAPSIQAPKPQSPSCAICPHHAWGSKVTALGSVTRACSDSKKLAVALAANPTGPAQLLQIPPASLKGWSLFVKQLDERGVPLSGMVIRLGFDTSASYPKLTYRPVSWVTEEQANAVVHLIGSDETQNVVGATDKPRPAVPQLADVAAEMRTPSTPGGMYVLPETQSAPPAAAAPVVAQPVAIEQPQPPQAAQEVTRRRRKPDAAAPAAAPAPQPMPPAPAAAPLPNFAPAPQAAPAAPVGMQAAGADLDSMLDSIMGRA